MNPDAVALHCCEKLSQQMRNIFKEAEGKEDELKKWQGKKEELRLKASELRCTPSSLDLEIRESELRTEAYRAATREIESLREHYEEKWRLDDNTDLLKDFELETHELIRVEMEIQQIRLAKNGVSSEKAHRITKLIQEFTTKMSKLKSALDKLEMMQIRYGTKLNEITTEGSEARTLLAKLKTKFRNRQIREQEINQRIRAFSSALQAGEQMRRDNVGEDRESVEHYDDVDVEILNDRLKNERETRKQLESLVFYMQHWLCQEENFEEEVEMLEAIN